MINSWMYLQWSSCTLHLLACQVQVTVGDSGLCCVCVMSLECSSTALFMDLIAEIFFGSPLTWSLSQTPRKVISLSLSQTPLKVINLNLSQTPRKVINLSLSPTPRKVISLSLSQTPRKVINLEFIPNTSQSDQSEFILNTSQSDQSEFFWVCVFLQVLLALTLGCFLQIQVLAFSSPFLLTVETKVGWASWDCAHSVRVVFGGRCIFLQWYQHDLAL